MERNDRSLTTGMSENMEPEGKMRTEQDIIDEAVAEYKEQMLARKNIKKIDAAIDRLQQRRNEIDKMPLLYTSKWESRLWGKINEAIKASDSEGSQTAAG